MTIWYGGDYNPEQWGPEVWTEDMALMRRAGVNLMSVGIFSWASVEPRPGEFDFGWFDRVMDNFADNGIGASLATMTASPPPWLSHRHPEVLPRQEDGTILWPGSRQHYCPSSPVYRDYAARLVEQVAARYSGHPALTIWHIGNEFGCHVRQCFCDVSAEDFRRWLRARYGTIDELNRAWATSFWSQRYSDWAEIHPPRTAPTLLNPGQRLDFARFSDDALLECYRAEREIVRRFSDKPVTTNFIGLVHKPIDSFKWALEQDVVSLDSYPDPVSGRAHKEAALGYDLVRSARGGQPWLLMEQAPSAVNWREHNVPKPPGTMRLWSWQAVAQGADAVMFFQWRQSLGGAERFHSAMVPHGGTQTRVYEEIRALGQELTLVEGGGRIRADVAVLHDWDNWHAVEGDAHPARIDLFETLMAHYEPLFDANVTCDVVHPSADLSGYKLVVVPNLYLLHDGSALTRYVHNGGHLLVSYFSGIVDAHDRVHPGGYPAPLREVLGLRVDEFWPLSEPTMLSFNGTRDTASLWSEWLTLEGADVVATFDDGRPAVTRHAHGAGLAWYVATRPSPSLMRTLLDNACAEAGVQPVLTGLPEGVQAIRRGRHLFLLNHSGERVTVAVPPGGTPLIGTAKLDPRDVAVWSYPEGV
ncbi:beta-galactosidase [Allorhizocola rhizosphaerae]|uniref:beta-galactosidase n=1 Tax=Allorhizocola rhizosphaerae TaxID=1872709 RepID=UPI000E3BD8D4|nr:beta-galactosidase [Allorhizocola rhizosphaerae]